MNEISFIHLSDIHFRKNSDNPADIDADLRNAILTDLENAKRSLANINSVLVCGDIAFSGKKEEYEIARSFLKKITDNLELKENSVFCVPGNHDVDQNIPKQSTTIFEVQNKIDQAETIDKADSVFEDKINDGFCPDILFKTISEYNEFASKFSCNINNTKPVWEEEIKLDFGISLCLWGMNSCYISNADDHKDESVERLMYVGQSQIPSASREKVYMTLCHHPDSLWKFRDVISQKFLSRAEIQLFGHMHTQKALLNENNIILYSGAVHPDRRYDWKPRYNWIRIEILKENEERVFKVQIFPRVLSDDRSRFVPDTNEQETTKNYLEQLIYIDRKKRDCLDDVAQESEIIRKVDQDVITTKVDNDVNIRDLVYDFLNLPSNKQTRILLNLSLLSGDDQGRKYSNIMNEIINRAKASNKLKELHDKVKEEL